MRFLTGLAFLVLLLPYLAAVWVHDLVADEPWFES